MAEPKPSDFLEVSVLRLNTRKKTLLQRFPLLKPGHKRIIDIDPVTRIHIERPKVYSDDKTESKQE